ncbi:hypothetical protein HOA91_04525 [Candidatus Woesearchaeota archaeon]|nr:hypothetical protein [Candidatus Woesearchaeota archaeon]
MGFIDTLTSPFGFFYGFFLVLFAIISYWGIYTIVHAASMLHEINSGKIPAKKELNTLVVKLGKNKLKVQYKRPFFTSQIFAYYNGKEVFKKTLVNLVAVYIKYLTFWRKKSYEFILPNKNKVKLVILHHIFSFTEKQFTIEIFINGKSKGKFDTWDFPEGIKNIKEDLKL